MQVFLNGLISGCSIALLAAAFQLVYLPTRVFFLGLAGIVSLAPYIVIAVQKKGGSLPLAIGCSIGVCILVSVLCEWANHARLHRRRVTPGVQFVASLGTYMVIVQSVVFLWGSQPNVLVFGKDQTVNIGGIVLTAGQIQQLLAALILLPALFALLKLTNLGLRLRALADNPFQFALSGLSAPKHRIVAFALSGLLAAIAAIISAKDVGFDPYVGLHALLLAIVSVYIGDSTGFIGPIVGALILGITRSEIAWFLDARWQEPATFCLLAVLLLLRPQGIVGKKVRLEATA